MANKTEQSKIGHVAKARTLSSPISTKHAVEICYHIRYKSTSAAKQALESAMSLKRAIPFRKFNKDLGHKVGMAAGRYPIKAASIILQLVKSAEANAQDLGLDVSTLKISKAIANKAAVQATGGRRRSTGKRTHVELEVVEFTPKKKKPSKKQSQKKQEKKVAVTKVEKSQVKVQEKPVEKQIEKSSTKEAEKVETEQKAAVPEETKNVEPIKDTDNQKDSQKEKEMVMKK
tara:strand:+ start:241 stop:933 length:693 start_codon:yes stop_codon:yes gene_type:complete